MTRDKNLPFFLCIVCILYVAQKFPMEPSAQAVGDILFGAILGLTWHRHRLLEANSRAEKWKSHGERPRIQDYAKMKEIDREDA